MAALTVAGTGKAHELLESVAITNQTDNTATVTKAVPVPQWANYATFVVDVTAMAGTSPLWDFTIKGVNSTLGFPDGDNLFLLGAGWDGITQKTAASCTTIHLGPDVTTDDSGSATADDAYGVGCVLPPYLAYSYTTDGTTDDEDYTATISVFFR